MSAAASLPPVPHADVDAIPDLVASLRARFDSGETRPIEWRLDQLKKLESVLRDNEAALSAALGADLRKPEIEGYMMDIGVVATEIAEMRKKLKSWMKPQRTATPIAIQPAKSFIVREPLGVVLIIAPWNYPVQLAMAPLAAALAAGNVAVVKPSEMTPHTSGVLSKLIAQTFAPDVVACVEGGVQETTALLAERFDHIFYTGNGRVGRVVMQAAAKHLTPVTLELGGKSPCIVDAECDLEVAARRIAWGKFVNCGQTCVAPDYVLVHPSREEELVKLLAKNIREFYGDDPQRSPDLARIVSDQHVDRLAKLMESGTATVGGQVDRADRYIAPTILQNVSPESPVMQDEIFGPILPILPVANIDDAIRFVNQREKPLALYVFTSRQEVEDAVLARTSAGGVSVNTVVWHVGNFHLPFGGVGESGMGAYHGRHGFETFSHHKSVLKKSTKVDPKLAYPPYTRFKKALIKRFA
jgi:aldehyde dehydrogenase (NAD+)